MNEFFKQKKIFYVLIACSSMKGSHYRPTYAFADGAYRIFRRECGHLMEKRPVR